MIQLNWKKKHPTGKKTQKNVLGDNEIATDSEKGFKNFLEASSGQVTVKDSGI